MTHLCVLHKTATHTGTISFLSQYIYALHGINNLHIWAYMSMFGFLKGRALLCFIKTILGNHDGPGVSKERAKEHTPTIVKVS